MTTTKRPWIERAIEGATFGMLGIVYASTIVAMALFDVALVRRDVGAGNVVAFLFIMVFSGIWVPILMRFRATAKRAHAPEPLPEAANARAQGVSMAWAIAATVALYMLLWQAWPFFGELIFGRLYRNG